MLLHTLPLGHTSRHTGPTLEYMRIPIDKWFNLAIMLMPPEHQVYFPRYVLIMYPPVVDHPVVVGFGSCLVREEYFDRLLHRHGLDVVEHHSVVAVHGCQAAIFDLVHALQAEEGVFFLYYDWVHQDIVDFVTIGDQVY